MGQRVDIRPGFAKDNWIYNAASGGATGTTNVSFTPALAGSACCLSTLVIQNIHATVATEIVIRDGGSGGTIIMRIACPAVMNNATVVNFIPPIQSTTGNQLSWTPITTGAQTYVNATGFYAQVT